MLKEIYIEALKSLLQKDVHLSALPQWPPSTHRLFGDIFLLIQQQRHCSDCWWTLRAIPLEVCFSAKSHTFSLQRSHQYTLTQRLSDFWSQNPFTFFTIIEDPKELLFWFYLLIYTVLDIKTEKNSKYLLTINQYIT